MGLLKCIEWRGLAWIVVTLVCAHALWGWWGVGLTWGLISWIDRLMVVNIRTKGNWPLG
jgi:hypothetical protein